MTNILTVTLNPTVDISSEAEVIRPVRKVRTHNDRFDPGGGGINVARVISRFGGGVEALYLAGGEIGALLDRLLKEQGVPGHRVSVDGQTRIGFVVFEESTGLEYRFVPEGPRIGEEHLTQCLDVVTSHGGDYVVCSGSLPAGAPDDIYARMAAAAASRGARFVLDSSGPGLRTTLERSRAFLVKPSKGELEQLVGRKLDADGVAAAAADLVKRDIAELVAVTMGGDGALLASKNGVFRLPAIPVRVRSAVGAGDSFLAGMLWALLRGDEPEQAFALGVAAGAAAVMTPGTELCERESVFALYDAHGKDAANPPRGAE